MQQFRTFGPQSQLPFKFGLSRFCGLFNRSGGRASTDPQTICAPSLDELVALIRGAANEFSCSRDASEKPGGAFLSLVDVLCYQHSWLKSMSQRTSSSRSRSEQDAGPLIDFLLDLCEHPDGLSEEMLASHVPTLNFLLSLSLTDEAATVMAPEVAQDQKDSASFTFTVDLCAQLGSAWRLQQSMHWSPFPWSTRSLEEGIPPPSASLDYRAPLMVAFPSKQVAPNSCKCADMPVHDDLCYFPDIPWLGSHHDGYCRATSLSAYVWLRLIDSAVEVSSRSECLALWQSALTFGVLEILTGMRIPENLLLLRLADGSLVLHSKKVSAVISSWLFEGTVTPRRKVIFRRINDVSTTVIWALSAMDEASMHAQTGIFRDTGLAPHVLDDILCGMWTFLSTLSHFTSTLCEKYSIPKVDIWLPAAGTPVYRKYERMLVAKGWCPYTMELLGLTAEPIVYATRFTPFFRSSLDEHAPCVRGPIGRGRCVAYNVNTAEYKTQHASTCTTPSSCPFLSPSLARVVDLLSSGQIPVIVYDEDSSSLRVRSATDGPYVAISHVWADGLGSTTEVGLPTCQVARIAAHARQVVSGGAFWVDALCVPEVKELRKRAIGLMAETYRGAHAVVVFEAGLCALCNSASPLKELIFWISTSPCMQRVWTLQEALLARDLYFEFADGLFPMKHLEEAYEDSVKHTASTPLGSVSHLALQLFLDASGPALLRMLGRASGALTFKDIIYLLQNRTTSKSADETVAIAGLLGIDTARLLAEPDIDTRMRVFLLAVGSLPADIIFASTAGANLEYPGFRWAPRALMSLQPRSIRRQAGMARCMPEGLTTEQKFGLVVLQRPVHVGESEANPDTVYITNPADGSLYILPGLRALAGERALAFNGLVTSPGHLESLKEGSSMIFAVAAYITTQDCSSFPPSRQKPVVCEHRLVVCISDVTALYASSRPMGEQAGPPVVEGGFSMVRITMT